MAPETISRELPRVYTVWFYPEAVGGACARYRVYLSAGAADGHTARIVATNLDSPAPPEARGTGAWQRSSALGAAALVEQIGSEISAMNRGVLPQYSDECWRR